MESVYNSFTIKSAVFPIFRTTLKRNRSDKPELPAFVSINLHAGTTFTTKINITLFGGVPNTNMYLLL